MLQLEQELKRAVAAALDEDLGYQTALQGDITANLIPENHMAAATVICRQEAVIAGQAWVDEVFRQLGDKVQVNWQVKDGDRVKANATLFELCGVKISPQAEGKSLVPLLDNDPNTTINQDYAFGQYARLKGKVMGYSIRTDKYRYTEWHKNSYRSGQSYNQGNIQAAELYDYEKDPNETKNFVKDAAYATIKADLKAKWEGQLAKRK